jgi:hypothetical protein
MIRIRSIVAQINVVINITKTVREAKARIWVVVAFKEEEECVLIQRSSQA